MLRPFPPLPDLSMSLRDVLATGVLSQRELIDASKLGSLAGERGLPRLDREVLEGWDERGTLSPICFVRGLWAHHPWSSPYPLDGIEFRDENGFRPWSEYEFDQYGYPQINALYSEWQLLYAPIAHEASSFPVPIELLLAGGAPLQDWSQAEGVQGLGSIYTKTATELELEWRGMVKALLRLQVRYWPYVRGSASMLRDETTHELVDPVEREYEQFTASDVCTQLGLDEQDVRNGYEYLSHRAQGVDPTARLHGLLRLEPRRRSERDRGLRRQALDLYDSAEMLRRFYREVTGELLPDADQMVREDDEEPRSLRRDPGQLGVELRRNRLYPHRLHVVVEGETEVRVVKRLFEAFAARTWEGSGMQITDIKGDKLKGSRPMLDGFGAYADHIALLFDNENDVKLVLERLNLTRDDASLHVHLCEPSFEEENFSDPELVAVACKLADAKGETLTLSAEELREAHTTRNEGRKRPRGLASILVDLARDPKRGAVVLTKPEIGDALAEFLLKEIEDAPGRHDEVKEKRPIVKWVMAHPLRAHLT